MLIFYDRFHGYNNNNTKFIKCRNAVRRLRKLVLQQMSCYTCDQHSWIAPLIT